MWPQKADIQFAILTRCCTTDRCIFLKLSRTNSAAFFPSATAPALGWEAFWLLKFPALKFLQRCCSIVFSFFFSFFVAQCVCTSASRWRLLVVFEQSILAISRLYSLQNVCKLSNYLHHLSGYSLLIDFHLAMRTDLERLLRTIDDWKNELSPELKDW